MTQYHLAIDEGDIAPTVLMPGDPGRVPVIAALWDDAAAEGLGFPYHVGLTRSADSFYAGHPRPGSSFGGFWQSWWAGEFDDLNRLNVVAGEMEASLMFVLARVWRLRAGGISVVLDNARKVSAKGEEFDPDTQFEHTADYIQRLARLGCEIVRELHEQDERRAAAAGRPTAANR